MRKPTAEPAKVRVSANGGGPGCCPGRPRGPIPGGFSGAPFQRHRGVNAARAAAMGVGARNEPARMERRVASNSGCRCLPSGVRELGRPDYGRMKSPSFPAAGFLRGGCNGCAAGSQRNKQPFIFVYLGKGARRVREYFPEILLHNGITEYSP